MTNDFDIKAARKQLDALRAKHGADTPIGHRCSNLLEQLKNLDGATGQQRKDLEKFIAQQMADLERLFSGQTLDAEE
jgi:hypothetical protein